jgi:hypothetical protein
MCFKWLRRFYGVFLGLISSPEAPVLKTSNSVAGTNWAFNVVFDVLTAMTLKSNFFVGTKKA